MASRAPPKNSWKQGRMGSHHVLSCKWEREEDGKQPGRAKPVINSSVAGSTATTSWFHHELSLHSAPQPMWTWVYLCIFLCASPPFCGSVFPSTCRFVSVCLSLFFILPAFLCFLSVFVDGCNGLMLILSWYSLVHILPYFFLKAPLSSLSLSTISPTLIYSDTFYALFTELS